MAVFGWRWMLLADLVFSDLSNCFNTLANRHSLVTSPRIGRWNEMPVRDVREPRDTNLISYGMHHSVSFNSSNISDNTTRRSKYNVKWQAPSLSASNNNCNTDLLDKHVMCVESISRTRVTSWATSCLYHFTSISYNFNLAILSLISKSSCWRLQRPPTDCSWYWLFCVGGGSFNATVEMKEKWTRFV